LSEVQRDTSGLVAGSFRDREGRVYLHGERVFRGLSARALEHFRALRETSFFARAQAAGQVVASHEVSAADTGLPEQVQAQWAGFLEHQPLAQVTYPYEWTFGMLQAAALLQLDLLEQALLEGYTVKDATPYNVQFTTKGPVFIDIPSFEPLAEGEPWSGYRQFCEMYLFPLMLQAYKGVDFQPFLRSAIDGVRLQVINKLFNTRDILRGGVLGHVWLHARLDLGYGNTGKNVRGSIRSAGFHKEMILTNLRRLRKLVGKLKWTPGGTEWADYQDFHNYSETDLGRKEAFVRQSVAAAEPHTVWDIGCNTGRFSRIAASQAGQVLAMDLDHGAVERLYRAEDRPGNILPLLQNLADPSPDWGWRCTERTSLPQRNRPDMVLCLALIHHVVISANIPLAEFIDWLAGLTPALVIEYVSREDDKVQQLLRNKEDRYADYRRANLEQQLQRHYTIVRTLEMSEGRRYLYFCQQQKA
jgi:ribosomal protein L11 methylase PrmA